MEIPCYVAENSEQFIGSQLQMWMPIQNSYRSWTSLGLTLKYNVTIYSLMKNRNKNTSDVNRKVKVFL